MSNLTQLERGWGTDRKKKFEEWVLNFFKDEVGVDDEEERKNLFKILERNKFSGFYGLALAGNVPMNQWNGVEDGDRNYLLPGHAAPIQNLVDRAKTETPPA